MYIFELDIFLVNLLLLIILHLKNRKRKKAINDFKTLHLLQSSIVHSYFGIALCAILYILYV